MSHKQARKIVIAEIRDLSAKLRFALLSIVFLPPVGATLTSLGVSRAVAAVVVFIGLALLFLTFVVGRVSESAHIAAEQYEREKIAALFGRLSTASAVAQPIPTWENVLVRVTSRLAEFFSDRPRLAG